MADDDPLSQVTMPPETMAERIDADARTWAAGAKAGGAAALRAAASTLLEEAVTLARGAAAVGAPALVAVASGVLSATATLRTLADVAEGATDTHALRVANTAAVAEKWDKKCHEE